MPPSLAILALKYCHLGALIPQAGEREGATQADRAQDTLYQINDTQHRQRMKYS